MLRQKESKAQMVWKLFSQLSQIPRGSGQCQQACQWLMEWARQHHFVCRQDTAGNILIEAPATPGKETDAPIMLQSHIDMVCQKTPQSTHDFSRDPIANIERDGWIYADNTTLGADNGIGLCLSLAAALDNSIKHPPLELLITVDEETGLNGAVALDAAFFRSRRMLNLDSEDDDSITIGCAGGEQTDIYLPFKKLPCPPSLRGFRLTVTGLTGGHSGIDIHRQRGNALALMGHLLLSLNNQAEIQVSAISGGSAHNAIARDCYADIALNEKDIAPAQILLELLRQSYRGIYQETDPNFSIQSIPLPDTKNGILDSTARNQLLDLLSALPCGVYRMDKKLDMVETSSNIGIIEMLNNPDRVHLLVSQRSSVEACLKEITRKINALVRLAGASLSNNTGYPAWQPDTHSQLLRDCQSCYREVFGGEPAIKAVHAGLETGIIGQKVPGMEMISLGPTIQGAHSPQECVNIESVDRVWTLLGHLLGKL